jgi:hypothetical protein
MMKISTFPLKDVTTRFNENRETQVSKGTVQRSLYPKGYNRRVVKKKVRIREVNRKKRVRKSSLGRWTNTISGLGLVLFPPNINPIIVSNDHLTFV